MTTRTNAKAALLTAQHEMKVAEATCHAPTIETARRNYVVASQAWDKSVRKNAVTGRAAEILRELHLYAGKLSSGEIIRIYDSVEDEESGPGVRDMLLRAGCTTDDNA